MNSKFLGMDGLTQTSANHIANIAKEMYESLEAKLDSIRLVSGSFTLAAVGTSFPVSVASSKEELNELSSTLEQIARLKAIISWLREGIKAKKVKALKIVIPESLRETCESVNAVAANK